MTFDDKCHSVWSVDRITTLAFHFTLEENIELVCENCDNMENMLTQLVSIHSIARVMVQ